MDNRKWQANAKAGAPTVPVSPSSGFPGNGGVGDPPTTPGDWWYHQIGEELRSVIVAATLTPTHSTVNQLLAALTAGWGMAKSLAVPGYITLPGGLIIQWFSITSLAANGGSAGFTLPIAFPNASFSLHVNLVAGARVNTTVGGFLSSLSAGAVYSSTGATGAAVDALCNVLVIGR